MKATTTWILVANGTQAFIALNHGPGHGIEQDLEHEFQGENLHSRDIMADAPGRSFDSGGQGRHAMERPSDPQRLTQQEFAREIAAYIDKAAEKKKFDRLVVVAAPHMLGDLRQHLSHNTKDKITAELSKDLTQTPLHKLPDHLGEVMAI